MEGLNENQFLEAYDAFADAIFRHCYFRVFDREKAKDIMQETFIKTWEYLEKGNRVENLRAFLYRVANNLIIDETRKKKTVSLDDLREQGFDAGNEKDVKEMVNNAESARLRLLLTKLDDAYRDVLIMRYIDDLPLKEIAEILDETENAVSVRIYRGVQRLREMIKEKVK